MDTDGDLFERVTQLLSDARWTWQTPIYTLHEDDLAHEVITLIRAAPEPAPSGDVAARFERLAAAVRECLVNDGGVHNAWYPSVDLAEKFPDILLAWDAPQERGDTRIADAVKIARGGDPWPDI